MTKGYDGEKGRRWNTDPVVKHHESPYAAFGDNPIWFVDPNGADTLLVNGKSGNILDTKLGGEDYVYTTRHNKLKKNSWRKSDQLMHALNISGDNGGPPSKKGDPVVWSDLRDMTYEFDQVLNYGIVEWSINREIYNDQEFSIPGNKFFEKNREFKSLVTDGAKWDIKDNIYHVGRIGEWSWYNGRLARYDDYGNLSYGANGAAFGLNKSWLKLGSHINQLGKSGLDEGRDTYNIEEGIRLYNRYQNRIPTIE